MRLSTEPGRDEARAVATLQAALDAGVRLLDTADAYARDDTETGHNERLIARALESWPGDRSEVRVATKGGLTRPGGAWVADGRARHLVEACAASRHALGLDRIALYQLHAPDPRVPLATSLRALASLQREGWVEEIGLSNVSARDLREALDAAPLWSVQVELSPWQDAAVRGGLLELCRERGIRLLAHRPLGGAAGRARLSHDPVLRSIAQARGTSPAEVVLEWLRSLGPLVIPLPGPTREETARALRSAGPLSAADLERLDAHFPAGRLAREPRASRRPPATATGEVVLVMGLPGAGKSTLAAELVAGGYERLNRDEAGGRLAGLVPALEAHLAEGRRRVVLDNTYATRASRNVVIEAAWRHGVPVRCVWLQTSLEDAQRNVVERMLARHGRLLGPDELRRGARSDPGALAPRVLYRHRRELEPPDEAEGFSRVDVVSFRRRAPPGHEARAVLFWYEGVLRRSRTGARSPRSPDDVVIVPAWAERLRAYAAEGWRVLGLSWHPEVAAGQMTEADVEAVYARTHERAGMDIEHLWCPHGEGPAACWCRKPLPGLGVALVERHRLDPARCLYVGREGIDRTFARVMGFTFVDASEGPAALRPS